jgi:hypothetical protein
MPSYLVAWYTNCVKQAMMQSTRLTYRTRIVQLTLKSLMFQSKKNEQ